ncbi:HNH endonuclease [Kineococcus rhizosphaerae]|uniref:HNH endonuclease n=1 Tax=Kineococcus rhizosphaerae TaxID=559628 RepID=UPI001B80657C|nr:HNH endonuclease [Kineococcus rhizosphaerae]
MTQPAGASPNASQSDLDAVAFESAATAGSATSRGAVLEALADILQHLPTPITDQLLDSDPALGMPVPQVSLSEAYERAGALITRPEHAPGVAEALTRQDATYRAHHLLAALLVDALHSQTAGSGIAPADAATLVSNVMDRLHVQTMLPHIPTPHEQLRREWERQAKRMSATVFARDGYTCCYCGTCAGLTVDHKVPLVLGGTNDLDNLQTLCGSCNSRKGHRPNLGMTPGRSHQ